MDWLTCSIANRAEPRVAVLAGIELVGSIALKVDAVHLSFGRLYKADLIHRRAPWKTRQSLELATLEWVAWFNHQRLHSTIGYIPPAEAEENDYNQLASNDK